MIRTGKFSSVSDIVNIATAFILGDLAAEKADLNSDSEIIENMPIDESETTKISVTLSNYLNAELENLAKVTQKNKSFIVRMALFRFFDYYNNAEKAKKQIIIPDEKITISKKELKEMVHELLNEINHKK